MITVRAMVATDLEAVLAVDYAGSQQPWSGERFAAELANPLATLELALIDDEVAGDLCTWLVAGELEIHNIVTAPAFRRRGVARRLLDQMLARARESGLERALLEVRVGNHPAIGLYRSYGFVACGMRSKYYRDGEDALLMEMTE